MKVRIGTRGSDLAMWQARWVAARLEAADHEVEVVMLETRGDRLDDVPLHWIEGKAYFTAEIEMALSAGHIDLAVHSHKDLPVAGAPGLVIAAVPSRGNPLERLLIALRAHDRRSPFLPVARGATLGTSSPRRGEQVLALRPDLRVEPLRGNVPTRVQRLREGRFDAILLAAAGLERLALDTSDMVALEFPAERLVPAPAQGALAVQARASDRELCELVRANLHDVDTAAAVNAERGLLAQAGGGCNLPLGCQIARAEGGWRASAFLGADHPIAGAAPRWAVACAADPAQAAREVLQRLAAGTPTGTGPLEGLKVAITGASGGGTRLAARLEVLGATVLHERVLAFQDLEDAGISARLATLRAGDGLALTSKEAARRMEGVRVCDGVVVGAVGSATARALSDAGIKVTCVGEAGARDLGRRLPVDPGRRVLFPCAESALSELEEALRERGIEVERLPLYRTISLPPAALCAEVDARVYMSPSAVEACLNQEPLRAGKPAMRLALGPATAAELDRMGLAHRRLREWGPEGLVHALAEEWLPQEVRS